MEVIGYSAKSIVVRGDTKNYKDGLMAIGGKFNKNLKNDDGSVYPGWIFSKNKEAEVLEFIQAVENGEVAEIVPKQFTKPVPKPITKPNITLETTMNKFQGSSPSSNKPVQTLHTTSTTLNYPNNFVGADNIQYQIVVQTYQLPSLHQKITLKVDNQDLNYTISKVNANNDILIISDEQQTSRAVIINSKWQIFCLDREHQLIFHSK